MEQEEPRTSVSACTCFEGRREVPWGRWGHFARRAGPHMLWQREMKPKCGPRCPPRRPVSVPWQERTACLQPGRDVIPLSDASSEAQKTDWSRGEAGGRETDRGHGGDTGAQSRQTRSPGSLGEVRSAGARGVADGPPTPTELRAERRCQAASLAAAKGTAVRLGVT